MLTKPTTHYEALEISTDASPHEVREAYVRLKSAYNKDSVALYSLVGTDEREEILIRVEEAYQILADPEKRKEYDRCHEEIGAALGSGFDGWLGGDSPPFQEPSKNGSIVSIDRTPPMENSDSPDALLIPPRMDAHETAPPPPSNPPSASRAFGLSETLGRPSSSLRGLGPDKPGHRPAQPAASSDTSPTDRAISAMIDLETDWRGESLRKVRENRMVSLEELAASTKISKTYLTAIENDDYSKLPAAVFTRGFLIQLCRLLKLPQEKVVAVYMARFNQAREATRDSN